MTEPILEIDQGTLRGSIATDWDGSPYFRFRGIPYAKPPIGDLRFKAPQPPEKWNGILDATKEGNPSYARYMLDTSRIVGSEDCLFLNVYTRKLPGGNTQLQPVMVFIHSGGFVFGSGDTDLYGPEFIITENVVLVTINYRLGIFGFLSSENTSLGIPGNAGFKDMAMALKWVQKNIAKFNGDPDNVTIFGQSAGGSAVHFLTLSPMTKDLFHKAIAQSGSAINPWVQACHCLSYVGPAVDLDGADESAVLEYLQRASAEEILEIQDKIFDVIDVTKPRLFGVVVEEGPAEDVFMPAPPIDILLSGKFNPIPFMAGHTSAEGMVMELFKGLEFSSQLEVTQKIHRLLGYDTESKDYADLAACIQKFYYGDEEPGYANLDKTIMLDSDNLLIYPIYTAVKIHASQSSSPVFFYRFSLDTSLNLFKIKAKITQPGASHCDDVCYLFKNIMTPKIEPGSVEDRAMRRMVKLWTNFASQGNPTPEESDSLLGVKWRPIEDGKMNFLDIDETLTMGCDPYPERMAYWREIYRKSPGGFKYV